MTPIELIHQALDKANSSQQFKKAKLVATIEENIINRTVSLLVNKKEVITIKSLNLSEALVEIEKWLLIASLPIYKDLNVVEENGEFVIVAK